jgi:enamine deaminase RidA (YjgF/YER057c/UK114 family)
MKNTQVKKNNFCGLEEFYITIKKSDKLDLHKIIMEIREKKLVILKITFSGEYAYAEKYADILAAYPTLFIGDNPKIQFGKKGIPSMLVQAARGIEKYAYLKKAGKVVGVSYQSGEARFLSVTGVDKLIDKKLDFASQAKKNYQYLAVILQANNFQLKDVYRFWNYIEDVLTNYAKFNQARNVYFEKNKLNEYPAATGIDAHLANGAQISVGFEAIQGKSEIVKRRISSKMQCEAVSYGPKFSRAMLLTCPKKKTKKLYVSGTSSVDKQGKSILLDNPKKNVAYVVSCVEHLLGKNRLSLKDVVTAFVYFKNKKLEQAFKKLYRTNGWTFPYNPFFVEICRDNFLFEIECIVANRSSDATKEIFQVN